MKSLLGEQDDAFRRILPLYDRTNQFGVMECEVPASIAKCSANTRKLLPFPEGQLTARATEDLAEIWLLIAQSEHILCL